MKKTIVLIFTLFTTLCYSQSKDDHFNGKLLEFDKSVSEHPDKAKLILIEIGKDNGFQENNSLKTAVYNNWGTYFKITNQLDSALFYYDKSCKAGLTGKLNDKVAVAYHNKAEVLSMQNQIDSALKYDKLSLQFIESTNNNLRNLVNVSIARKLRYKGEYRESNKILFESLKDIPESDPETKGVALTTIAMNYDDLELLDLTEKYYLRANDYLKKSKNKRLISNNIANLVDLYNGKKEYTKALIYADSIIYFSNSDNSQIFYHIRKANTYKDLKNWGLAIEHINKALELDKKLKDEYGYTLDLILKGQVYRDKGDFKTAFTILSESKQLFEKNNIDYVLMEKQLYRDFIYCYLQINNPALAENFNHFLAINDTLANQSADKNLTELEAKYNSEQKELQIAQQQLEIEKQKYHRNFSLAGGGFLLLLVIGGFFWFRNQQKRKELESQNTLLGLQQNISKIELNQLNQQLDPHEIKNLLAGISPEIQQKAPESYKRIIKLLNITKASLNNHSLTENISLQIEQATNYLDLQKNVLQKKFDYQINVNIHHNENAILPRLLLKNLAENAVKHGLDEFDKNVLIKLEIHSEADYLCVTVSDNGRGFQSDSFNKNGIGLSTYKKLFETLNTKNKQKAEMLITDNKPGTCVSAKIPLTYIYE